MKFTPLNCQKGPIQRFKRIMGKDVSMNRPIKVMQIIARMNVGGPAILVADLVRNIDSSKFEQILVTGYCDAVEADYLDRVAVDIKAVRIEGLGRSVSPVKDLLSYFELIKVIRKYKPDVIHTHTAKAGVLGRLAAVIARPLAKRVHTFHGHLLHGYFSKPITGVVILVEKVLAMISSRLIAIGNVVKQDLVKAGIGRLDKYEVIFPGLQPLEIVEKKFARSALDLDPSRIYIGFVGRLTQIKRPDRLVDIARFLKKKHPKVSLLIAGEGELFESTKGIAQSEGLPMVFLGWRNDINVVLSACDLAVLSSDNEGIPLTLIQAAQAGLPIVSTNVGSVSDIVVDGVNGLLTDVSSEALIEGISVLLEDLELGKKFGLAGAQRAEELFSSKAMVAKHEALYSQIV